MCKKNMNTIFKRQSAKSCIIEDALNRHPVKQFLERDNGFCMAGMGAKLFFHPDHTVPAVEFIAAVFKHSCQFIAQMAVEISAVSGKIFIFLIRPCDAGVKIEDILGSKCVLQSFIEFFSNPCAAGISPYINGNLSAPVIGCPFMKRACISIA